MLFEHQDEHNSKYAVPTSIAGKIGCTGDAYDNALAETINGLLKTEVIRLRGALERSGGCGICDT